MFASAGAISFKLIRLLLLVVASAFLFVALGYTDPAVEQAPKHVRVKVSAQHRPHMGHGVKTGAQDNHVGVGGQEHDAGDSMLLQGAQRFLDLPDEQTLEELQAGNVRAASTAPARHSGESKATAAETKTNDNQHMLLTRLEKSRIAQHLQDVVYKYQDEYRQYMDQHVYGYPPEDEDVDDLYVQAFYREPLAEPHSTECRKHEPGLVRVKDPRRLYCFGASALQGARICDTALPDYTKLHDEDRGHDVYELYGKKFAYIPYYHRAQYTGADEPAQGKLKDAVTVASQGSWNRLEHLQKLVKLWQGPVSFALLLDSQSQLADLDAVLAADANLEKFLDLHVAWRVDHSMDDQGAFYPINVLRNMGLQTVLTGLVFILDVDNIPSGPMSAFRKWTVEAEAAAGETASEAVCPGLDAFIPPAVEMSADRVARMYDESRERGSLPDRIAKDVLVDSFYDGTVKPMHAYFGPAYVPTNHFNWSTTHTVDPIKYLTRFEPYYLARMPIPLFNESFVNRGGNYAQQVYEMHAAGYRFFRLPTGFIVDIPHEKASVPKAKSSGPVQENRTKQAAHDEAFIANVWLAFADWVSHRYGINMPSPAVSDLMFRKYRRAQEKVTNAMWHLLGLEEVLEADNDEDE